MSYDTSFWAAGSPSERGIAFAAGVQTSTIAAVINETIGICFSCGAALHISTLNRSLCAHMSYMTYMCTYMSHNMEEEEETRAMH